MLWSKEFQTALYSLDGVGPVTFQKVLMILKKSAATEEDFWVNKGELWSKIPLNKSIVNSIQRFKKEHTSSSYLASLNERDIRVILESDSEYPPLLKQLTNHPPLLFARGAKLTGRGDFLAVVGTRDMTAYGRQVVRDFIPLLARSRKTIVSGFMYGVDVAAQRAALKNKGKTVGVLGFGFDHMYPPEQQSLFYQFLEQGATFLSPFAPHVPAKPGNFPARNTVVAGMSEGTLVIEGAEDSGSLITAHIAAELGREVWAVPGSIYSRYSVGTQTLMNEGAQLVNSPEEVLGLTPRKGKLEQRQKSWANLPKFKQQLCELLWVESVTVDDLLKKLHCQTVQLSTALVELEMIGMIKQVGNKWQLR